MVEVRKTRSPLRRAWTLAVVGLASVGCTMCPDPFDYSGPVPNGSAPQNDFRARSGGILPLGVAPKPWPLIVKGDTEDGQIANGEPIAADADVLGEELAAEVVGDELRQTAAVEGDSEEAGRPDVPTEAAPVSAEEPTPRFEPVPAVTAAPSLPAGETPGWHARRR